VKNNCLLYFKVYSSPIQSVVVIDTHNPYKLDVELLVKCNWSNVHEEFIFNKVIKVKANSNTKLILPSNLRKCEVWPKIRFFR
jgi:hypothetical protein